MTSEDRIVNGVSEMSDEDVRTELTHLLILQQYNKKSEINTSLANLLRKLTFKSVWNE